MNTYDQKQKATSERAAGRGHAEQAAGTRASAQSERPEVATLQHLRQTLDDSPRVQSQHALGQTLGGGARAATQAKLAATLDSVAQFRTSEEDELKAVQPKCDSVTSCEEDNEVKERAPLGESVGLVQGKFQPAAAGGAGTDSGGLPGGLRAGIEALSGVGMGDVRVEYNSPEPAKIKALATTQGKSIRLGPGQERHLPHEAWHAAQQKQGRVRATTQLRGLSVNDDAGLEHEADVMGARAARMPLAGGLPTEEATQRRVANHRGVAGVAQRQAEDKEKVGEDTGGALEKAITLIKKMAEAGEPNEQTRELEEYVAELEEIARGDDEELKAATLDTLDKEAEKQAGTSLEEVTDEASDLTSGAKAEPVQGNFIWTFLSGLVSRHPYAALTTTVAVVGLTLLKVKAEKSRKTLPPEPRATLFVDDPAQYWAHLRRYIQQYCKSNGVSAKDKGNLVTASVQAINASAYENQFLNQYVIAAQGLTWDNAQLGQKQFFDDNLYTPFLMDMGVIISKSIGHANVSTTDLTGFTAALQKLPFVKALYAGKVLGGDNKKKSAKKKKSSDDLAQWQDGGRLDGKIQLIDDGINYVSKARGDVDNGQMAKRVIEADRFIRRLVEPEILGELPRPTIAVHLRNNQGFTSPLGLRAYTAGNVIHIAQNQTTDIIVHELGHYIEDNLPVEQWAEVHTLLQKRKGTQTMASHISPIYVNEKLSLDEQRYPGTYPATGGYTSRYYTSGSTEVTSRTVEYLSHPTRFKTLIETDPQQAALILRLLRPKEFAKENSLKTYVTKYLPTTRS